MRMPISQPTSPPPELSDPHGLYSHHEVALADVAQYLGLSTESGACPNTELQEMAHHAATQARIQRERLSNMSVDQLNQHQPTVDHDSMMMFADLSEREAMDTAAVRARQPAPAPMVAIYGMSRHHHPAHDHLEHRHDILSDPLHAQHAMADATAGGNIPALGMGLDMTLNTHGPVSTRSRQNSIIPHPHGEDEPMVEALDEDHDYCLFSQRSHNYRGGGGDM